MVSDFKGETITVEKYPILNLVEQIKAGQIRIPRFQRKFVWSRAQVFRLLDSIYWEYPIGTLFLWEASPEYSHYIRTVDYLNQPPIEPGQPHRFLLDGQQRLTSLYLTTQGQPIGGEDYNKYVFDLSLHDTSRSFRYRKPDNRRWVSIKDLADVTETAIFDNLKNPAYQRGFNTWRRVFLSYPVPVVIIRYFDLTEAIEIFDRINSSGQQLSSYDLVTSSALTETFDLRERSQTDIIKPLANLFGEIPETMIPQALALNLKLDIRAESQMRLDAKAVEDAWEDTVRCFKLAVDFLRENLYVANMGFLPYEGILLGLVHYFYFGKTTAVLSPFHRGQLEQWFWQTVFGQRYSSSSVTRINEDAVWMQRLIGVDDPFTDEPAIDINNLSRMSVSSRSAIIRGVLCVLNQRTPLDFRNGSRINVADDHYSNVTAAEYHHIFPTGYLQHHNIRRAMVRRVANFCFLPADTSEWIRELPPSDYMKVLQDLHGLEQFEKVMTSHLIPVYKGAAIWSNKYPAFLKERAMMIQGEILRLCGVDSAALPQVLTDEQIDMIKDTVRDQIHARLTHAFGADYWSQAVPTTTRVRMEATIQSKARHRAANSNLAELAPATRLGYGDLQDFTAIIKNNWSLFEGVFNPRDTFEQHMDVLRELTIPGTGNDAARHPSNEQRNIEAVVWFVRALHITLS